MVEKTCANCAHRAGRHHPTEVRSQKPRLPWVCLMCCRAVGPESCGVRSFTWRSGEPIYTAPCGIRHRDGKAEPRDWEAMPQ